MESVVPLQYTQQGCDTHTGVIDMWIYWTEMCCELYVLYNAVELVRCISLCCVNIML